MRRRRPSRRFLISSSRFCLLCVAQPSLFAASSDDDFRKLTQTFIEDDLRTYPEMATEEGDHRYDNRLTDMSRAAIEAASRRPKNGSIEFEASSPEHLAAADEADREWLDRAARRPPARRRSNSAPTSARPDEYLPIGALHSLIKRNFAPLEVRMRSATARETAALHNLAVARVNLKPARTAKVTVDIVLSQMPGMIEFPPEGSPEAFASIPDGPAKTAFLKANAKLVAAVQDYAQMVEERFHAACDRQLCDRRRRLQAHARRPGDGRHPARRSLNVGEDEMVRLQADFDEDRASASIRITIPPKSPRRSIASIRPPSNSFRPSLRASRSCASMWSRIISRRFPPRCRRWCARLRPRCARRPSPRWTRRGHSRNPPRRTFT